MGNLRKIQTIHPAKASFNPLCVQLDMGPDNCPARSSIDEFQSAMRAIRYGADIVDINIELVESFNPLCVQLDMG